MTLWAISAYFNPAAYRSKKQNYDCFRTHLSIPLITVELAYGESFELGPSDAEHLIQLRGHDVMWQKERLLNIALSALPSDCSAVAWLDADVIFENPDWPAQTLEALQSRSFIQPFDKILDLAAGQTLADLSQLSAQGISVMAALHHSRLPADYFASHGKSQSLGLAPGRAWAARRAILDRVGFYDAMIVGGGDRAILNALLGQSEAYIQSYRLGPAHASHYRSWAEAVAAQPSAQPGYLEGRLTHLWHGPIAERAYSDRQSLLARYNFDPSQDIASQPGQVWRWSSQKPELHDLVVQYFASRNEDAVIDQRASG